MIDLEEGAKSDGDFQNDTVTRSETIDNKEHNETNKNETGRGLEIVDLEEGTKIDGNLHISLGEGAKNDDSQDEMETRLEIIDDEESAEDDNNKETGTRSMMIDPGEGAELNDNNQTVPGTRSELINIEHCSENDGNNQNETGTISETIDVEEGPTEIQVEVPGLVEDFVTPVLKLLTFNIVLPFIDIYFDIRLIHKLQPQHLGCLLVILSGLILHFIFTCFAWWRLEPRAQKKWSWIFLILQIWPQMKAVQVRQRLIFVIPDQNLHKKEDYRSLVTWRHDITDHFIQC